MLFLHCLFPDSACLSSGLSPCIPRPSSVPVIPWTPQSTMDPPSQQSHAATVQMSLWLLA